VKDRTEAIELVAKIIAEALATNDENWMDYALTPHESHEHHVQDNMNDARELAKKILDALGEAE